MPKICKHESCEYPIFSRKSGYCKKHLYLFKQDTPKRYLSQKSTKIETKLKQVSSKQAKSNIAVQQAKANVVQKMLDTHGYLFCESCGTSQPPLDKSHIIPIGKNKALEAVELNIIIQCRKCHTIWEQLHPDSINFTNFAAMLKRVKALDLNFYNKIKTKFNLE